MLLRHAGDAVLVGNLGPTSDELWHAEHRDRNFYTYGSMGLCSSIALVELMFIVFYRWRHFAQFIVLEIKFLTPTCTFHTHP